MVHLLRRPAAVPALFSPGVESDPARSRGNRATSRSSSEGSTLPIFPTLVLAAELPMMRGAAELLRLVLPH